MMQQIAHLGPGANDSMPSRFDLVPSCLHQETVSFFPVKTGSVCPQMVKGKSCLGARKSRPVFLPLE